MIGVLFEREDGTQYRAELEPDWKIHLADGSIIFAEDIEVGDEIESHHFNETGGRGHIALKVMDD
jgi:hypothetical protein